MGIVRYTVANGQLLAESRDGVAKRYVGDPLGSTAALVDTTGAITDTFTYWPYGEERTRTGTTPTPFRFGGTLGYYRDDAGRTYVQSREADPNVGRWQQRDSSHIGLGITAPYRYCRSNPLSWVDSTGTKAKKPPGNRGGRAPTKPPKWAPFLRPNIVIIWKDPGGVGGAGGGNHLRICVPNSGGGCTWWGFYPNDPKRGGGFGTGPGFIRRDDEPPPETHGGGQFVIAYGRPGDIAQINQNIQNSRPGRYNVNSNNCTDWAAEMLTPLKPVDPNEIRHPEDLLAIYGGRRF